MREKDDSARGKILEAAKTEFMERGFAEASMRTIAERAGFTTGMLYSRFADKSEIFRETPTSHRKSTVWSISSTITLTLSS